MSRFCRKAAMAAAAAAVMGAAVMGAAGPTMAQPMPPAPPTSTDTAPQPGPGWGPPPWAWQHMRGDRGQRFGGGQPGPGWGPPPWASQHMHGDRGERFGGPMGPRGPLTGLVMRRDDKQITADEATRIAEGFLLWMGERDWKVANATQQDDVIRFDLTTKEGSRIATFTMDRKTGEVKRVG